MFLSILTLLDVDLLVCKHQGPSCCTRRMEESYQFAVKRETLHNIHSYSYELRHLLSEQADAFQGKGWERWGQAWVGWGCSKTLACWRKENRSGGLVSLHRAFGCRALSTTTFDLRPNSNNSWTEGTPEKNKITLCLLHAQNIGLVFGDKGVLLSSPQSQ